MGLGGLVKLTQGSQSEVVKAGNKAGIKKLKKSLAGMIDVDSYCTQTEMGT